MKQTFSSPNIDAASIAVDSLRIIDTTYYSDGFPDELWSEIIPRTQYISQIEDAIAGNNKVIFIEGEDDAGKTTLIAQFCRKHIDRTISVFFNPLNNLDFELDFFYTNVVQQIRYLMKDDQPNEKSFIGNQQYREAHYQFKKFSKRHKHKINLVLDGLENKTKEDAEFIVKLFSNLPFGDEKFVLIITGSKNDYAKIHPKLPKEQITSIPVFGFADPEAISYLKLADNGINIRDLYKVTKGYPGRLRTLRNLISQYNYSLTDIKTNTNYLSWIELDCNSIDLDNPEENLIFSVLAQSERTFNLADLAEITELDTSFLENVLVKSALVSGIDKNVSFISSAHKKYLANLLRAKRPIVNDKLIAFYSKNESLSALLDLPRLYAEEKDWSEIIELVDDDYFNKVLERTGSLKLVTETLELGVQAAEKLGRHPDLLRYSIQGSILKELENYQFWESEIEARISINDYHGAISLAESAIISVDRLNLLALIARRQKEFTNKVDEDLINLIQELYKIIDLSDAGEKIYDIVAHLMYAIPNLAIEMIEKSSSGLEDNNINDWVVAKLSVAAIDASLKDENKSDSGRKMEVVQNLKNPSVKKINRAIGFLVGNYSAAKVLEEVQKISDPYEKFKLLRLWLNNNKNFSAGVDKVITAALDELIHSSSETSITVEVLTELSRQLPQIKDKIAAKQIYDRFNSIANDLSELGLTKNKYVYKLNIFHCEFNIDRSKSIQTINELINEVEALDDILIKLEAFAEIFRKLSVIHNLVFKDKINFIYRSILSLSSDLYKSTALQTKISENFLETIGSVNPKLALKAISEINNIERREQARMLVLSSYLDNDLKNIKLDLLRLIETEFESTFSKERFYLEVLERYSIAKDLHPNIVLQVTQYQQNLLSLSKISDKIKGLTSLYNIVCHDVEWKRKLSSKIESQIYQSWKSLDADWEKIDYGFQICYQVAKQSPSFAKKLFEESECLKASTWCDSRLIAATYLNSMKLVIKAFNGLLVSKTDNNADFQTLSELINKVPSELSKLRCWTEIGFYALDSKRDDVFRKIVSDHVALIVHDLITKNVSLEMALDSLTIIHLHDSGIAQSNIRKLKPELRELAYNRICYYHITKKHPFEIYNFSVNNFDVGFLDLTKALSVLAQINIDNEVYYLLTLICQAIQANKGLSAPQVTALLTELRNIAKSKFPDPKNITHDGFKILAEQQIAKISKRIVIDVAYWETVIDETEAIPNLSDKIFVKAVLLDEFPFDRLPNQKVIKKKLFDEISEALNNLPVHYEYVQRVIDLSEIMYKVDKNLWKKYVEKAFTLSASLDDGADRYSSQRSIIDSMYRLDPAYSKQLIKQTDTENQQHKINKLLVKHYEALEVADKIKKGKTLEQKEKENTWTIVKSVYSALKDLNSDQVAPKKINEMVWYLLHGNKLPLHEVFPIFLFYMSNCAKTYRTITDGVTKNLHRENFKECVEASNLIQIVSQKKKNKDKNGRQNFVDQEFSLNSSFRPKTREIAFQFIRSWIEEQVEEFIIIADPGFIEQDLEILKIIKETGVKVNVDILGSEFIKTVDIENLYLTHWKSITEDEPPFANFTFCHVKDDLEPPFDGKWIITKNSGLKIGTNISLLGSKRDGEIAVLKPNEALRICEDTLIEYVNRKKSSLNNQRVYYKGFSF